MECSVKVVVLEQEVMRKDRRPLHCIKNLLSRERTSLSNPSRNGEIK